MKVGLPKVLNIVSKLIGQELASVTPNTEETNNNIKWSNEEKGQTTEEDELWKKFERKKNSKKPYTPTSEEFTIIKELLTADDDYINTCTISIMNDGEISVSTSRASWLALAGREWWINTKDKTIKCVAMN
jgi:hypothetical protein